MSNGAKFKNAPKNLSSFLRDEK